MFVAFDIPKDVEKKVCGRFGEGNIFYQKN